MNLYYFSLMLCGFAGLFFFYLTWLVVRRNAIKFVDCRTEEECQTNIKWHVAGIILLGIIPITLRLFYWKLSSGFLSLPSLYSLYHLAWILLLPITIWVAVWQSGKAARKKSIVSSLTGSYLLIIYLPLRILFIIVYEIFFRGILLFDSLELMPALAAISLNISLYFLLHLFSGNAERTATLFFGSLMCIVCLMMQSVWPAIVLHLALTLTYEFNYVGKIHLFQNQSSWKFF